MKKILLLFALLAALAFHSCSKGIHNPALKVGVDPISVYLVEQDSFNIPLWLRSGQEKRTLVHISADNGFNPISPDMLSYLQGLAKSKDTAAVAAYGNRTRREKIYDARNMVFLAHRLGIIDEVYWVVPSLQHLTGGDLESYKSFLKKEYPGQSAEVDALKLDGAIIAGVINGVPVKILALQDLPAIGKPVLLDIDVSIFSMLYQDEKSTRILALVSGLVANLKDKDISSDSVTVSASNEGGPVPLRFRCVAVYLKEILGKPDMLKNRPPALWAMRAEAWKIEQKSINESLPVYEDIVRKYPGDAAGHYDLAAAYAAVGNNAGFQKEFAEAARIDQGYARTLITAVKTMEPSKSGRR